MDQNGEGVITPGAEVLSGEIVTSQTTEGHTSDTEPAATAPTEVPQSALPVLTGDQLEAAVKAAEAEIGIERTPRGTFIRFLQKGVERAVHVCTSFGCTGITQTS